MTSNVETLTTDVNSLTDAVQRDLACVTSEQENLKSDLDVVKHQHSTLNTDIQTDLTSIREKQSSWETQFHTDLTKIWNEQTRSSSTIQGKQSCLSPFSATELKAQVHYYDHALSVDRRPSLVFHIFDFSETAEWNFMKINTKEDLNVLYQVFFLDYRKIEMAVLTSDWLRLLRLLLLNR